MSLFKSDPVPTQEAASLCAAAMNKIALEKARLCPNLTGQIVKNGVKGSLDGPFRDEHLLFDCLDELGWVMERVIEGDTLYLDEFQDRFGKDNKIREDWWVYDFIWGDWKPDYNKWLSVRQEEENEIDDEARAYQAKWEKEHRRAWPTPKLKDQVP